MKKKIFYGSMVGVLIMLSLLPTGCKNEIDGTLSQSEVSDPIEVSGSFSADVPFASAEELEKASFTDCYERDGFLDYRVARDYAFAEFYAQVENFYPECIVTDLGYPDISNCKDKLSFSDEPVIVYDYDDKPYYYEFAILFNQEEIIGTAVASAQPSSTELLEFLFPYPIQYGKTNFSYRRYVGEYPIVYYGNNKSQLFRIDVINEEDTYTEKLVPVENVLLSTNKAELLANRIYSTLSSEEIENMERDLAELEVSDPENKSITIGDYIKSFEIPEHVKKLWNATHMALQGTTTQKFTITPELQKLIDANIKDISAKYVGFLPQYSSHYLRLTRWTDYCGPSALSWIYRGLYDNYEGKYLPILGDFSGKDYKYPDFSTTYNGKLAHAQYNMAPNSGEANTYQTRENRSNRTDKGLYYVFFRETVKTAGEYPLYDKGIRRGVKNATNGDYKIQFITYPIAWMTDHKLPVLVEGINGDPHYWAAIGYAYNKNWAGTKTHLRIFVADNGYWLQEHNYYPYWSILGGLNYAIKKK